MKGLKQIILLLGIFFQVFAANSQILTPIKWSTNVNGKYIEATAILEPGWHLYSQHNKDFPFPTKFIFDSTSLFSGNQQVVDFNDCDFFDEPPCDLFIFNTNLIHFRYLVRNILLGCTAYG